MSGRFAGQTLAGRYDLLELLGKGGMGDVYRARDRELDELVALKVIRDELRGDAAIVERFRHEVKLARRVTHANVARTFELGTSDGVMFCTMELIEGESLTQHLAGRTLSVGEAATIASAVCDALAAAHAAGVIHRDVKPDNVLLADGRVVVADFGVAAIAVAGSGELSGTPAYMAPEQARGETPTPAADVYSLGAMLYEMVTGRRAFPGAVASVLASKQAVTRLEVPADVEVPPELAELIGRATERDLAARIQTAAELGHELARWARPSRAPTAHARAEARDVRTLIVVAPRAAGDAPRMAVADAVQELLLRRLSKLSRVRVQPRQEPPPDGGAFAIAMIASEMLEIAATPPGERSPALVLRLPLDVARIGATAEVAAQAVAALLGFLELPADPVTPARELVVEARHLMKQGTAPLRQVLDVLEQARALAPDDPAVAAHLARSLAVRSFMRVDNAAAMLAEAKMLARLAVERAPELAEAQLAAGHVELQTGSAAIAASHFRLAIACSPYLAEGHVWLGCMLLEAGYLTDAVERLDHALAITPDLPSAMWELARAHALEGRWDDHDRLVAHLRVKSDRMLARARYAWWRGDHAQLAEIAAQMKALPPDRAFDSLVVEAFRQLVDHDWPRVRERLVRDAIELPTPSLRRRAFTAQLVAETAGVHGDVESCTRLVDHATANGLFDLHWLDRCPALAPARAAGTLAAARVKIKQRADAILDALYGDHVLRGLGETVAATR